MKKYARLFLTLVATGFLGYGVIIAVAFVGPSQNPPDGYGALKIGATGNVGIGLGAADPASKLTVAGTVESTIGGIKFPDATVQTTASPWSASGSDIYNINAGNVGIGVAAPAQKLDVNGNIKTSGRIYGGGSASAYGAVTVDGAKNSWSGINFQNLGVNYGTLMAYKDGGGNSYSGFFKPSDGGWDWYWLNGVLQEGSVPATRITGSLPSSQVSGREYIQAQIYQTAPNVGLAVAGCTGSKKVMGGGCIGGVSTCIPYQTYPFDGPAYGYNSGFICRWVTSGGAPCGGEFYSYAYAICQ